MSVVTIVETCSDCDGTGMTENHYDRCLYRRGISKQCTCKAVKCGTCCGKGEVTR